MADQAQGSDIRQIAFAASLCHGHNVIGIPKCPSANPLQPPTGEQVLPVRPARALEVEISGAAIDPANRAHALIAGQYLLAQIARVRAKTPFMHTPIRAKCEPARRDLKVAPAAESAAVLPFLKSGSIGKPAGHGARSAHETFLP
jgi:hypothetical protein